MTTATTIVLTAKLFAVEMTPVAPAFIRFGCFIKINGEKFEADSKRFHVAAEVWLFRYLQEPSTISACSHCREETYDTYMSRLCSWMKTDTCLNRTGAVSFARFLDTSRRDLTEGRSRYFSTSLNNSKGSRSIVGLVVGTDSERSIVAADEECEYYGKMLGL